ncbi:MAG: hypothetical protein DIU71_12195 [Proteobacteria bacterium]|nr:MAG: hypothetical protein DIU71_12195 [Pseudomonadota bacterium]
MQLPTRPEPWPQPSAAHEVPALTVVIPVYNEAGNITPLVKEIQAALASRCDSDTAMAVKRAEGVARILAGSTDHSPRLLCMSFRSARYRARPGRPAPRAPRELPEWLPPA